MSVNGAIMAKCSFKAFIGHLNLNRLNCLDMVSIYTAFPRKAIEVNDNYSGEILPQCLNNVRFRVEKSSENNFITSVGVCNGKAQSITNKQLHYVPEIIGGVSGHYYGKELYATYQNILETSDENTIAISTPVFYFMDFESVQGTGHSHDLSFYLLYYYKKYNLSYPLLIPNTTQHYMNTLYKLLEDYYGVTFIRVDYNQTYQIDSLYCLRSYLNVFLKDVKEFINTTLIDPILEKFKDEPSHTLIGKIKINKSKIAHTVNLPTVFEETQMFSDFCESKQIFLFDDNLSEELKIYYLNKADYLLLGWGSIYYIYLDYYLRSTENKFISVLFHKNYMPERRFLIQDNSIYGYRQCTVDNNIDNVYNMIKFKGEVIDNLESLDDYVNQTILKTL